MDLVNLVIIPIALVAWGMLVKYHPALKTIPNMLIAYMNTALAIIAQFVIPEPAHAAAVGSILGAGLGWLWPPIQATIAAQIYERFIRPVLEHQGIKKAV